MSKLNPMTEIMRYQSDRGLDKMPYDVDNEHANIAEELMESRGFDTPKKNRAKLKVLFKGFTRAFVVAKIATFTEPTKHMMVDAYGDIIVFCFGAIMKLGFDPRNVLVEVAKEINSREGSIVNGKFEKDMSEEGQAKWYKADFSECQLECDK